MLTFPSERPVFLREYAARQYGVIPYFVSKTIVELPVVFLAQAVMFLITYWLMGLHGNWLLLVVFSWLLGITSSGLSLIIGSAVTSVEKAIQLIPLVMLPQMLFSGLFIPVDSIPSSLKWVQYLCPLKYAINLLAMTEFQFVDDAAKACGDDPFASGCPGALQRKQLLKLQSIEFDDWGFNVTVLIALYFGFRILACIILWRKGKYVF